MTVAWLNTYVPTETWLKLLSISSKATPAFRYCSFWSLLLRTNLSPNPNFSNSFFLFSYVLLKSKKNPRILQKRGIKRRQRTGCASREYFPDIRNNSHQNPKDTNCLELLRELLKAAFFSFFFFFTIFLLHDLLKYNFMVYNLIRMLCRQVHYPSWVWFLFSVCPRWSGLVC